MAEDFGGFVARERERLNGERQAIFAQQRELERQLNAVHDEMRAIEAYESAKSGKSARGGGSSNGVARATRRGSKREELMSVIQSGNGLSRGEILDNMGLKGNKSGEMSVSNALTALTKNNAVRREGGKYLAA